MGSSLGKRRFRNPDRCITLLRRQAWMFLFVNSLLLSLSLSLSHFCCLSLSIFMCPASILSPSPPLCPLQFSPPRREFLPAVSQKERFCKIYLDIFHLLSNHSSLLFTPSPSFTLSLSPPVHLSSTQGIPFAAQSGLLH